MTDRHAQAEALQRQAETLFAEARRLQAEANRLQAKADQLRAGGSGLAPSHPSPEGARLLTRQQR